MSSETSMKLKAEKYVWWQSNIFFFAFLIYFTKITQNKKKNNQEF